MLRIGFVGLDTSHPATFYKHLHPMPDVKVTAAYDTGDIRSADYVQQFCREHEMTRCDRLEQMLDQIDAAMILNVDWDKHLELAKPFLEANIPVCIDKPIVGRLGDLKTLRQLAARTGTPVLAGSGWRFVDKVLEAHRQCAEGSADFVYAESRMPLYFYGIHAAELIVGLLGPGFTTVRALGPVNAEADTGPGMTFGLQHRSGTSALMRISASDYWRGAAYQVDRQWHRLEIDADDIHTTVCRRFVEMVRTGRTFDLPETLGESVRIMHAAALAAKHHRPIDLSQELPDEARFDGAEYVESYRRQGAAPKAPPAAGA